MSMRQGNGKGMSTVTAESVTALVLCLLTLVWAIRRGPRAKRLGRCAHCPRAGACPATQKETLGPDGAQIRHAARN